MDKRVVERYKGLLLRGGGTFVCVCTEPLSPFPLGLISTLNTPETVTHRINIKKKEFGGACIIL